VTDESGEQTKESAEQTKVSAEQTEQSVEQTKESAEQTKQSAEQTEQSAEQTEQSAEQTKQSVEQTKQSAEQTKESVEQTKSSVEQTKESVEQTKQSAEQTKQSVEQTKQSAEQTDDSAVPEADVVEPRGRWPRVGWPHPLWLAIALPAMAAAAALGFGIAELLDQVGVASPWRLPGCVLVAFGGAGIAIGRWSPGRPSIEAGIAAVITTVIGVLIVPFDELSAIAGNVVPRDVAIAFAWIFGGVCAYLMAAVGGLAGAELKRDVREGEADAWDRGGAWLAERGALYALGGITLAALAIHFGVFVGETAGDDLTFHFAESARIADCLRVGDFDFWNPSANAGYASAYYYQVVPQLASALPAAIFGHHLFWFQLSVVLPLVLAPAAAYRGMRLMGATRWQAVLAAFVIAFMNGQSRWGTGNAGTFVVGLYTQTWALAAFPLALGHGARWISEGEGLAPAIAWGAMVGTCHPFAVIALGIALTAPIAAQAVLALIDRVFAGLAPHSLVRTEKRALTNSWRDVGSGLADCIAALFKRWREPPRRRYLHELPRWAVLGGLMFLATMPVWLPLALDWDGFGGFPHRVDDEVGPGLWQTERGPGLLKWYGAGWILDFSAEKTFHLLTYALPIAIIFARGKFMRWLLAPALVYAVALALGPHLGKTQDDLFPMVRFLGAMQVVLGLAIGAGAVVIATALWRVTIESSIGVLVRVLLAAAAALFVGALLYSLWHDEGILLRFVWKLTLRKVDDINTLRIIGTIPLLVIPLFAATPVWRALGTQYGARTMMCAVGAALLVLVAIPGASALASRVRVMGEDSFRSERAEIDRKLATLPPGRKQVGPGAENHWWNLLSYAYIRVPSTLQMGGGGLQASPNYDFLWSNHDYVKNAHIYDAPYVVFQSSRGGNMPIGETLLKTNNYELRKLVAVGLVTPAQIVGVLPPGARKGEPGHDAALKWLASSDPMEDRLLAYDGFGAKGPPPDGKVLRAWRQDSPGGEPDIVADVEVHTTTTFVVRESWHPRWHAYIDGAEAPVMRVTPDFSAVDVPPGKHELAMRFERPWWAQAAWLAWPGIPLAAWLLLRELRRRRPRKSQP
jgi:hypothetical protein